MRPIDALPLVALFAVGCGAKTESGTSTDASVDASLDVGTDSGGSDLGVDLGVDADDPTTCSGPGTCLIAPKTCCGSCGVASATDMIGLEATHESSYRAAVCAGTPCPDCAGRPDPWLQAFCTAGHCQAVNLHVDDRTKCATKADCQLRYADCCEPCGAPTFGLIALRMDAIGDYRTAVCAAGVGCPKCAISYPPTAAADCDASGHCVVTGL